MEYLDIYGIKMISNEQVKIAEKWVDEKDNFLENEKINRGSYYDEIASTNVFFMVKMAELLIRIESLESRKESSNV